MIGWITTLLALLYLHINDAFSFSNSYYHNVKCNKFYSPLTIRQTRHTFQYGTILLHNVVSDDRRSTTEKAINKNEEEPTHITQQEQYRGISQAKPPSRAWLKRYEELKEFRDEEGHCNVLRNSKTLGNWVQKQRAAYKVSMAMNRNGKESSPSSSDEISAEANPNRAISPLSSFQIQLLNDIDFIWNVKEWSYQRNLYKLASFYQQNGHINLPMKISTEDEEKLQQQKSLYNWLRRQRDEYKKYLMGKKSSLTDQRRQALETCGFHIGMFDIGGSHADKSKRVRTFQRSSWKGRYEDLVEFKNEFGHCTVPTTDSKYSQLSGWVQHQRAEKKKKDRGLTSRLSDDKEKLLNDIGFIWNVQENVWQQRLDELREFKETHGHVRPHTKDGALGNWIMIQRLQYGLYRKGEKNTLSNERIEALNALGFEWDIQEASWLDKLNEVKVCIANCRDPNACDSVIFPNHLLSWISAQRSEKRYKLKGLHSHLTDEREKQLEEIGFDWKANKSRKQVREELWMKNFKKLSEYKLQHGSCRVAVKKSHSAEEKSFSHWVRDQRRYYKACMNDLDAPITAERVALLDSIGFADDIVP